MKINNFLKIKNKNHFEKIINEKKS